MSEICTTCFSTKGTKDESLANAVIKAREQAASSGKSVAIVEEDGEYILLDPFFAYENGLGSKVKQVISCIS